MTHLSFPTSGEKIELQSPGFAWGTYSNDELFEFVGSAIAVSAGLLRQEIFLPMRDGVRACDFGTALLVAVQSFPFSSKEGVDIDLPGVAGHRKYDRTTLLVFMCAELWIQREAIIERVLPKLKDRREAVALAEALVISAKVQAREGIDITQQPTLVDLDALSISILREAMSTRLASDQWFGGAQ